MVADWRNVTIGNFSPFQYGKGLPQRKRNEAGVIPVYGSNGVVGHHDKALIEKPAIIVGRKGTVGAVHYCKNPCWAIGTTFYIIEAKDGDLLFTYYLLSSLGLDNLNFDSAVPGLNRDIAHSWQVKVPPLEEQRKIAYVLSTLDDKIELNQQMNRNLEAIAQAIFKSWFMDFDPVRAKMEGRQPAGMNVETAALFPGSFEDSLLGKIPKGWRVLTIGDACEFAYGKALKENARRPGTVPVYGSNGQIGWHDEALVKGPGVVIGRKGNPGVVTWTSTDFFPIDTTFYVVPKTEIRSMHYFFYALYSLDLTSLGADSAVPGLNRHMAYITKLLAPPTEVLNAFDKHVAVFANRVSANKEQSLTLAAIRDALLPKLMSGEIRVKEAEQLVAAAA